MCGGDGSVGWVLSEIDALTLHKQVRALVLGASSAHALPPAHVSVASPVPAGGPASGNRQRPGPGFGLGLRLRRRRPAT